MTRIPEITRREQLDPADRHHFDTISAARGGDITAPFRYLLHVPGMAARMAHLTAWSRHESQADALPEAVRELAILATARETDCRFEWADHEQRALDAGVAADTVARIKVGTAPAGLTAADALVVRYVQQLLNAPHRIDDAVFEALRARLSDRHLVELTALIGMYAALACTFNAFDVAPTPGLPLLPPRSEAAA